ncbi:putative mitochondrial F1F0 ATP synthase subunit Atp18 [Aulographum hederae CBS 113979]|uniref:Putative mitochondrial F1F0 ATP synthase subunit Atp18 n=1 Tax=Aulographum hederae CBS 113979 TaxID=1176131 RepID=A0A6G1GS79_9PEZI|nr:putative mitochondrial F1F0 ATP synthase subunit Atp18 [Aulographum hederae CBS 113979]
MVSLGKKWPAPVATPMAPFYVAGIIVLYGVNATAEALKQSPEWKNDPRNTSAKKDAH